MRHVAPMRRDRRGVLRVIVWTGMTVSLRLSESAASRVTAAERRELVGRVT